MRENDGANAKSLEMGVHRVLQDARQFCIFYGDFLHRRASM